MAKCNQMIFDTNKNKDALQLAQKFLAGLLQHNIDSMDDYADIHIYQEETLIIVEWTQIFYDDNFPQDHFVLLDCDHTLVEEIIMPDNSILYVFDSDDKEERIATWHAGHPGWVRENGRWIKEK